MTGSFLDLFKSILNKKQKKEPVEPVPTLEPKPAKPLPTKPVTYGPIELPEVTVAAQKPEKFDKIVVMLDNGHGEETSGKRSPDGRLREYAYTREIVALLKPELEKLGMEVYVVVPETRDVKLTTRVNRAKKKNIEAEANGKTAIFISVHCNAAKNGVWYSARGWSGWTDKGKNNSDPLADCLYEAAHEVLDPKHIQIRKDKSDGDEDWESNFTVVYNTPYPSVLTENFFQDNKEDVEYLLSDEGKQDIVKIHIEGIKKYYRKYIAK